jgi:hypothetical protein
VTEYHRTKHAADRSLMNLPLDWMVLQPSLVYGPGGSSTRLFETLATLPVVPLPAGGRQLVQPVHIDDLVAAIVKAVESPVALRRVLAVVGPEPLELRAYLLGLRAALGAGRAITLTIPRALMRLGAWAGSFVSASMLDPESLRMLDAGSTADAAPLARWLGRPPRPVAQFVPRGEALSRQWTASLQWLLPMLRLSVAIMWAIAAVVSAGPYPVASSLALLESIGSPPALAPVMLWSAVLLDSGFAIASLLPRRPRALWTLQIAVVVGYTLIISWRLPHLWLEPFGPVAKNLPILALLLLLRQLERRA